MLYGLIAFLPVAVLLVASIFSKKGIFFASFSALLFLVATSLFVWNVPAIVIAASAIKGLFVSMEIGAIVLGAIFLFKSFSVARGESAARSIFGRFSSERIAQAVIVAWSFVYFIEGVSGFGTPAMIAAPILIALGFGPMAALTMCLIGDSVPVIFGAVGLPVTYGFGSIVGPLLAGQVGIMISIVNIISSFFVTAAIVFIANKDMKGDRSSFLRFMPFAALASLAVSLPAFLTSFFIGPELPSIIGGAVGTVVIFMIGKKMYPTSVRNNMERRSLSEDIKPFIPYIIAVALLSITRLPFVKEILSGIYFNIPAILGQNISHHFTPFYSAGVIFIFASLAYIIFSPSVAGKRTQIVRESLSRIWKPITILTTILIFVQIFVNSDNNTIGLSSMPEALITSLTGLPGGLWLFIAPFVGAFGAFIAGGATVSNLLMTSLQVQAASMMGLNVSVVLALQGLGAAGGNMIAIHNVLAALAVVGIAGGSEKKIMKLNLPFVVLYLIFLGLIGVIMSLILK